MTDGHAGRRYALFGDDVQADVLVDLTLSHVRALVRPCTRSRHYYDAPSSAGMQRSPWAAVSAGLHGLRSQAGART